MTTKADSKPEPKQQQYWILKCLKVGEPIRSWPVGSHRGREGGWTHGCLERLGGSAREERVHDITQAQGPAW
jgi:hypothetical protein